MKILLIASIILFTSCVREVPTEHKDIEVTYDTVYNEYDYEFGIGI